MSITECIAWLRSAQASKAAVFFSFYFFSFHFILFLKQEKFKKIMYELKFDSFVGSVMVCLFGVDRRL